jgi:cell division control protein 7
MTISRGRLPTEGMATTRSRAEEPFYIHEDAATEDTEMAQDDDRRIEDAEEQEVDDPDDNSSDSSDDMDLVDSAVVQDMAKLQSAFPGFRGKYRLIKRIGEGG